jgi:hypothetical protein
MLDDSIYHLALLIFIEEEPEGPENIILAFCKNTPGTVADMVAVR